ncbi:unnamed protein product [Cuscuta epithymum]|uniref:Uncharacterized protein n=1 Tax=Cuscuta epithymum TaxID=186058 RepID=A0AAV0FGM7_9ASTE|nr:unnamed protein product [Cuscuta epithymum]CAH9134523.1 unnamed protein product [Cuscuta epithymum]
MQELKIHGHSVRSLSLPMGCHVHRVILSPSFLEEKIINSDSQLFLLNDWPPYRKNRTFLSADTLCDLLLFLFSCIGSLQTSKTEKLYGVKPATDCFSILSHFHKTLLLKTKIVVPIILVMNSALLCRAIQMGFYFYLMLLVAN